MMDLGVLFKIGIVLSCILIVLINIIINKINKKCGLYKIQKIKKITY